MKTCSMPLEEKGLIYEKKNGVSSSGKLNLNTSSCTLNRTTYIKANHPNGTCPSPDLVPPALLWVQSSSKSLEFRPTR